MSWTTVVTHSPWGMTQIILFVGFIYWIETDIQYPGDATSAVITGLRPNSTHNVTVAALLTLDYELNPVGPIQLTTSKIDCVICRMIPSLEFAWLYFEQKKLFNA